MNKEEWEELKNKVKKEYGVDDQPRAGEMTDSYITRLVSLWDKCILEAINKNIQCKNTTISISKPITIRDKELS